MPGCAPYGKTGLIIGLAGGLLLGNTGCFSGMRAKALRHDAYYQHETGDNVRALAVIRRGVSAVAWPCVPGYVQIETYDDAGLYYYLNNQPRAAFVHQAVAVLLAEVHPTPGKMRQAYRQRLKLALAACTDVPVEEADLDRDVRILLQVPEVRENSLVQRYY